ncbi:MAG: 16S rRNA (cytosine(1402)-N(4))-methyltransferase RsmH, partial [Nevskiales bacterium]|nr:16S rRNA (cytosine(1402)-N(4))-methyltransferase RsmH [Nevskiales bacterium]
MSMSDHRPVMLEETLAGLGVHAGAVCVDATFGRGGHSAALLERLGGTGILHAFDRDPQAGAVAWRRFGARTNFRFHDACYSTLTEVCRAEGVSSAVNAVLFDLGVSSPQLDDAVRGFSFAQDGPLDMRMDPRRGESAAHWLRHASEEEIATVLWQYGEERNSRRIARALVQARERQALETTRQLVEVILSVQRGPRQKIHPATRSFQAIRIHINQELDRLATALTQAVEVLAPGGRLAVISFHSLEDRR